MLPADIAKAVTLLPDKVGAGMVKIGFRQCVTWCAALLGS